jgi:hypothetical protein
LLIVVGVSLYGYLAIIGKIDPDKIKDSLWPYHDRKTAILFKDWQHAEYKKFQPSNDPSGFVLLKCECNDPLNRGGISKVRFRGRVYVREAKKDWLDWECRNDGDNADLNITCTPLNR